MIKIISDSTCDLSPEYTWKDKNAWVYDVNWALDKEIEVLFL